MAKALDTTLSLWYNCCQAQQLARPGEMMELEGRMTVTEANRKYGVPPTTIRFACVHGYILASKLLGQWIFKPEDIEAWLANRPRPGPKEKTRTGTP